MSNPLSVGTSALLDRLSYKCLYRHIRPWLPLTTAGLGEFSAQSIQPITELWRKRSGWIDPWFLPVHEGKRSHESFLVATLWWSCMREKRHILNTSQYIETSLKQVPPMFSALKAWKKQPDVFFFFPSTFLNSCGISFVIWDGSQVKGQRLYKLDDSSVSPLGSVCSPLETVPDGWNYGASVGNGR